MKKKQIEAVPYITLPEVSGGKGVMYVGMTAWKNIGHVRHIILEVYRNSPEGLSVPVIRYAASREEWGVFEPGTGAWSQRGMGSNDWHSGLCWQQEKFRTMNEMRQASVLYSGEDLARIKNFFKGIRVYDESDWWEYFEKNETDIKNRRSEKKHRRRRELLKERIDNTPGLKEQELLKWADKKLFLGKHYLYYKKNGRKAQVCCSACGGAFSGTWKPGESYESCFFEKPVPEPVEGRPGTCMLCGSTGVYKCQGKAGWGYRKSARLFLADRYKENGIVLRYIDIGKEWLLEVAPGEKGKPEMVGACEKLDGIEVARTYFEPGKKPQTDYHKHNPYTREDFWDDCNLYGLNNIPVSEAAVHPDTWGSIKGTFLQYCAMDIYAEASGGKVNAKDYLERYREIPQIEMLVKMGLCKVVDRLVRCECGIAADINARRPEQFLGIRKDKLKYLAAMKGDVHILKVLQMEKRMGKFWTWQQVMALEEIEATVKDLEAALNIMSLQKLLNNISKYAGCGYGTECSGAEARLRHTATVYFDYLSMKREAGYDMGNTIYQKPRSLTEAHDMLVAEMNKQKASERLEEAAGRFPEIRKKYRKLREQYFYEDEKFVIRPARSAEEIVMEGRLLHHCVGKDEYLMKHGSGESIILMLRFKEEPEIPYVTVEIFPYGRIRQWYGKYDGKPDREEVQKWLDAYVHRLQYGRQSAEHSQEMAAAV